MRIYGDVEGESHFEHTEVEFHAINPAPSAPPADVSAFAPAMQYAFVYARSKWSGGCHRTPHHQLRFGISGSVKTKSVMAACGDSGPVAWCSWKTPLAKAM